MTEAAFPLRPASYVTPEPKAGVITSSRRCRYSPDANRGFGIKARNSPSMSHRRYHLELRSLAELRGKEFPPGDFTVRQLDARAAARCRSLWREVGRGYWTERHEWSPRDWETHLQRDSVRFFALTCGTEDLGGFELRQENRAVKLEGFGLVAAWRGRGLGSGLLSAATRLAFAWGATHLVLQTATDDHPHALPNYLARGFRVTREEAHEDPMPDSSGTGSIG